MEVKRSVTISGHRTSVALESEFWMALKEISSAQGLSQNALIAKIDEGRLEEHKEAPNLSRAIRLYVLRYYRERSSS